MAKEAPYSLRSYLAAKRGLASGQFADVDYAVADGVYNDVHGLFQALHLAGVIEPAGWSGDRSVTSWHIRPEFDRPHEHDLRWNPDGMIACIDGECPFFFKPPVEELPRWQSQWPHYEGPVPS